MTNSAIVLHKDSVARNKFELWCIHYFNQEDKETYLNGTKSALRAYDTENYHSASQIGHENLRKLENRAKRIADEAGLTLPALLRMGATKVMQGDFDDWAKFMDFLGYKGDDGGAGMSQKQEQQQSVNVQINNLIKEVEE